MKTGFETKWEGVDARHYITYVYLHEAYRKELANDFDVVFGRLGARISRVELLGRPQLGIGQLTLRRQCGW
jgi:hypothetical protein